MYLTVYFITTIVLVVMLNYFYYVADIITEKRRLKINIIYNLKIAFNKFNYSYTFKKIFIIYHLFFNKILDFFSS